MKTATIGRPRLPFRRTTGGWWNCELNVLKRMLSEKQPIPYIASVLDRNIHSVHSKIHILKGKGEL